MKLSAAFVSLPEDACAIGRNVASVSFVRTEAGIVVRQAENMNPVRAVMSASEKKRFLCLIMLRFRTLSLKQLRQGRTGVLNKNSLVIR
jgi:hypothetical protein